MDSSLRTFGDEGNREQGRHLHQTEPSGQVEHRHVAGLPQQQITDGEADRRDHADHKGLKAEIIAHGAADHHQSHHRHADADHLRPRWHFAQHQCCEHDREECLRLNNDAHQARQGRRGQSRRTARGTGSSSIVRPSDTNNRKEIAGLRTNRHGSAATAKRSAQNIAGESSCNPILLATNASPHTMATPTARAMSVGFMSVQSCRSCYIPSGPREIAATPVRDTSTRPSGTINATN